MQTETSLAKKLNGILGRYIAVQDTVFVESASRLVDFGDCRTRLAEVGVELRALTAAAAERLKSAPPGSSEARFLTALVSYASALGETVDKLSNMCLQLWYVSLDARLNKYNDQEYLRDLNDYQRSVQKYQTLGKRLNEALQAL